MKRLLLLALALLPVPLAAQEVTDRSPLQPRLNLTLTPADVAALEQVPANRLPPPPARESRRRRASMVGYINDAGIQSQLRVRFDVGQGIEAPDRAEFFYPKCGCYRGLDTDHPAYDPNAPGPAPGIASDIDFSQFYVQAEWAFSPRVSVYGELPFRSIRPQAFVPGTEPGFGNASGLSDLRAGVKLGLVATRETAVTFRVEGTFPTGDGGKGLGVEHGSVEPALLVSQAVGTRANVEGQFGVVYAFDGSDGIASSEPFSGHVLYYGFGPSVTVYEGDAVSFTPVVELVGWRVLSGFQTLDFREADGTNIVNLKVGARLGIKDHSSLYVGYGHHLTDAKWYDSIFRVEYRVTF